MAKKKATFVLRAKREGRFTNLYFLNGQYTTYACYKPWLRKTNIALQPGESQKVRFTLEKVED